MTKKINTKSVVIFYDDSGRKKTFFLKDILYENDNICLCNAAFMQESLFGVEDKTIRMEENLSNYKDEIILFDKNTGDVLTKDFYIYYAKNL